jgi:hypothetical protein
MQYHTQPLLTHANLHHIRRLSDGLAISTTWGAKGRGGNINTLFNSHKCVLSDWYPRYAVNTSIMVIFVSYNMLSRLNRYYPPFVVESRFWGIKFGIDFWMTCLGLYFGGIAMCGVAFRFTLSKYGIPITHTIQALMVTLLYPNRCSKSHKKRAQQLCWTFLGFKFQMKFVSLF